MLIDDKKLLFKMFMREGSVRKSLLGPLVVSKKHKTIYFHIAKTGGTSTSFPPTLVLGKSKGYTLLCDTGNMIFIRNDLFEAI